MQTIFAVLMRSRELREDLVERNTYCSGENTRKEWIRGLNPTIEPSGFCAESTGKRGGLNGSTQH
jgi:hypothetical protein